MREKRCRDPNDSSFYLVRYLFCQSLWSISHNTFQVCRTSASDEILSSHELGRIGVRLGRIWCFYFPSKKFFICRWTLSMDLMIDVSMTEAFSNLLTDFGLMNSFYQYTFWTRQHCMWYNLKHPNRHISVPIYLPKRHAGPPRVQFSRSLFIPCLTCGRQLRLYWIFAYIFVISYLDMF